MNPVLTALVRDTDKLVGQFEAREQRRDELAAEVQQLTAEITLLGHVDTALTALLQQTGAANLQAIEELVTSGLQAIFDDRGLSFKFEVEQARGQQALTPVLLSNGQAEGPLLDSHGGGPAQVVALLLRILTVHRLGLYPFLALDESLNMVSDQYIENAATFLNGLCDRLGLTIVMVTHKPAFAAAAARAYEIQSTSDGAVFTEVT